MTHRQDAIRDAARGRDIAARWCALAEQRLEHLTDMFESGRWRRYHSELAFLENIQEAKRAVEAWRSLATGQDAPAVSPAGAFSLGWSLHGAPAREQAQPPALQPMTLQPMTVDIAADSWVEVDFPDTPEPLAEFIDVMVAPQDDPVSALRERAAAAPHLAEFTFSLDGLEAKYPLLRNAF